jgi:hypothetical protein
MPCGVDSVKIHRRYENENKKTEPDLALRGDFAVQEKKRQERRRQNPAEDVGCVYFLRPYGIEGIGEEFDKYLQKAEIGYFIGVGIVNIKLPRRQRIIRRKQQDGGAGGGD